MTNYFLGTAVAPKGKVFYINKEKNIKVIFEWNACGWTSRTSSSASVSINGIPPQGGLLKGDPTPWNKKLVGEADANSWIFNLRPLEGQVKETLKTAKDLTNFRVKLN